MCNNGTKSPPVCSNTLIFFSQELFYEYTVGIVCFVRDGRNLHGYNQSLKDLSYLPLQDCGADCAKFQKSELEYKFNKRALERPYTSKHSWGKTYGEHKRHLEFSHDQYRELQKYAEEVGIFFTASGMDEVWAKLS